MNDDII